MYKTKSKISIKYFFILSILFFCSCDVKNSFNILRSSPTPTLSPELMDRSWLTDQPCRGPCWYGLTLGASQMSDAREIVRQLSFVDINTIEETDSTYFDPIKESFIGANVINYKCKTPKEICTSLYFVNNKLVEIYISPNFQIGLEDIINIIGPPDFLSFRPITPDKMFGRDCQIELYWVERQMTIRYYNYDNNNMCKVIKNSGNRPSPKLPIQEVWYLMPEYFMDRKVEDGYYPWTGFAEGK
jgi:hypothetical protein